MAEGSLMDLGHSMNAFNNIKHDIIRYVSVISDVEVYMLYIFAFRVEFRMTCSDDDEDEACDDSFPFFLDSASIFEDSTVAGASLFGITFPAEG
jgi:hypothetical protein